MNQLRGIAVSLGFCVALTTGTAAAQDLFELEVFEYESTPAHCVTTREPWLMKSVIGYRF